MTSLYSPFSYIPYESDIIDQDGKIELKVVGILQPKETISYGCLQNGFYYTDKLAEEVLKANLTSQIVTHYQNQFDSTEADENDSISSMGYPTPNPMNPTEQIITPMGITYDYTYIYEGVESEIIKGYVGSENQLSNILSSFIPGYGGNKTFTITLRQLGGKDIPSNISIYPINFESKYKVTDYLDSWNKDLSKPLVIGDKTFEGREEIKYADNLELIITLINTMIDIITYALIVFTALSLLVSTVMIGIITYVSVVERVKEIGVIRSLGGRKKDVANLFNAETFIIGLTSGVFGILITLGISAIINVIVGHFTMIYTIASLQLSDAIIMIVVSVLLTSISGLIPARAAARKNPVDALRTE